MSCKHLRICVLALSLVITVLMTSGCATFVQGDLLQRTDKISQKTIDAKPGVFMSSLEKPVPFVVKFKYDLSTSQISIMQTFIDGDKATPTGKDVAVSYTDNRALFEKNANAAVLVDYLKVDAKGVYSVIEANSSRGFGLSVFYVDKSDAVTGVFHTALMPLGILLAAATGDSSTMSYSILMPDKARVQSIGTMVDKQLTVMLDDQVDTFAAMPDLDAAAIRLDQFRKLYPKHAGGNAFRRSLCQKQLNKATDVGTLEAFYARYTKENYDPDNLLPTAKSRLIAELRKKSTFATNTRAFELSNAKQDFNAMQATAVSLADKQFMEFTAINMLKDKSMLFAVSVRLKGGGERKANGAEGWLEGMFKADVNRTVRDYSVDTSLALKSSPAFPLRYGPGVAPN